MRDFGESCRARAARRRSPSTTAAASGWWPSRAPGSGTATTGSPTLGQIVEDVSGEPLDRYLREHIFEPLGMTDTDLVRSERVTARLATGYELRSPRREGGRRAARW